MSRVFEALQRQLQNENNSIEHRDPLAAKVGTPDAAGASDASDASDAPAAPVGSEFRSAVRRDVSALFDPAPAIGSPEGPRSNEGAIIPSLLSSQDFAHSHPANGQVKSDGAPEIGVPPLQWKRPVLARLPQEVHVIELDQTRVHPRLVLLTAPYAPECEQFRTLRTELFHAAETKRTQILTVTSAVADEGKTSTLLNLALSIAQSKERRILVIEGDLRRPSFSSYLALQPAVGLNDVLSGERDLFSSIFCLQMSGQMSGQMSEGLGLYVLPVTKEAKNPTEMLSSERLGEMLAQLREYFDFILLDSPPVIPFADSRLLANHSDAVILVIRAGVAPYETVEKAIEALARGRILGIVLNGAEHIRESDYYDYYYYYARRQEEPRTIHEKITNRLRKKPTRRRN
jgi:capsular exopolysaccharide synthesis family protein